MSDTLDTLADAALAVALVDADATNAFVTGSTANITLISDTAAAQTAMRAARDAAEAAMGMVSLNTPADLLAAVATAASLAQDNAALAEITNALDTLRSA